MKLIPTKCMILLLKNENDVSCKKLIELSKQKGGRDNISVIVFEGV